MKSKQIFEEGVRWDNVQWWAFESTVMNLQNPLQGGN
jgi:hypothetical protein